MNRWKDIFWKNIYTYINLIVQYLKNIEHKDIYVQEAIDKFDYSGKEKIKRKEYKKEGEIPIIDQGQNFVGGYTNKYEAKIEIKNPVIIFGDHTKHKKYLDFSFALGADGVKVLKPKKFFHPKFFYYLLFAINLEDKGYSRHYKLLKNQWVYLPYPNSLEKSLKIQNAISNFFDNLENESIDKDKIYFNKNIENKIINIQRTSFKIHELNFQIIKQKSHIQKLRQQILQEAIQGKLTEEWRRQNPYVEPASELLERIKGEKEKLVKEGKIKKQKPLPPVKEEEKPFELPEGWVWCRLGEVISINSGDGLTQKQMDNNKNIPVYGGNGIVGYHSKWNVTESKIIIGRVGANCGVIHESHNKAWITDNAFIVDFSNNHIDKEWLIFKLKGLQLGNRSFKGSQPVISGKRINPILFALPPLKEQKVIVNKLKVVLDKCDQLQEQIEKNEQYTDKLMHAVLREAFEVD